MWVQKTSFLPSLFLEVTIPIQENERSCSNNHSFFHPFLYYISKLSKPSCIRCHNECWNISKIKQNKRRKIDFLNIHDHTNFIVFGLTRLGSNLTFASPVASTLTIAPPKRFTRKDYQHLHSCDIIE
jgi:hypothetical protein